MDLKWVERQFGHSDEIIGAFDLVSRWGIDREDVAFVLSLKGRSSSMEVQLQLIKDNDGLWMFSVSATDAAEIHVFGGGILDNGMIFTCRGDFHPPELQRVLHDFIIDDGRNKTKRFIECELGPVDKNALENFRVAFKSKFYQDIGGPPPPIVAALPADTVREMRRITARLRAFRYQEIIRLASAVVRQKE
jgi:hypothetical protein